MCRWSLPFARTAPSSLRAQEPGHAGRRAPKRKFDEQYAVRLPGSRLVLLIVEVCGRWHGSAPPLLRRLARTCVARAIGLGPQVVGLVVSRWAARLSAAVLRGNEAVLRQAGCSNPPRCEADVGVGAPPRTSCAGGPVGLRAPGDQLSPRASGVQSACPGVQVLVAVRVARVHAGSFLRSALTLMGMRLRLCTLLPF